MTKIKVKTSIQHQHQFVKLPPPLAGPEHSVIASPLPRLFIFQNKKHIQELKRKRTHPG